MIMKEIIPICSVCNKKANKRKLFLPIRDSILMGINNRCLCEKCFLRLPYDLHIPIIKNAESKNNDEESIGFNALIINALKNSDYRMKLNKGYCILLNARHKRFVKYIAKRNFKDALLKYSSLPIYASFFNGHKISSNSS